MEIRAHCKGEVRRKHSRETWIYLGAICMSYAERSASHNLLPMWNLKKKNVDLKPTIALKVTRKCRWQRDYESWLMLKVKVTRSRLLQAYMTHSKNLDEERHFERSLHRNGKCLRRDMFNPLWMLICLYMHWNIILPHQCASLTPFNLSPNKLNEFRLYLYKKKEK